MLRVGWGGVGGKGETNKWVHPPTPPPSTNRHIYVELICRSNGWELDAKTWYVESVSVKKNDPPTKITKFEKMCKRELRKNVLSAKMTNMTRFWATKMAILATKIAR